MSSAAEAHHEQQQQHQQQQRHHGLLVHLDGTVVKGFGRGGKQLGCPTGALGVDAPLGLSQGEAKGRRGCSRCGQWLGSVGWWLVDAAGRGLALRCSREV